MCPGTNLKLTSLKSVPSPTSLAALRTRCGHFAFAFTPNRERPSAIRRAWACALTATTVRPRSAAMSKTEALEITSSRSRSSSSEVQAFALFSFFASVSPGSCSFPGSRRRRLIFLCLRFGRALTVDAGARFFGGRVRASALRVIVHCSLIMVWRAPSAADREATVSDRRTVVSNPLLYARRCAGSRLSYVILRSRVAS